MAMSFLLAGAREMLLIHVAFTINTCSIIINTCSIKQLSGAFCLLKCNLPSTLLSTYIYILKHIIYDKINTQLFL